MNLPQTNATGLHNSILHKNTWKFLTLNQNTLTLVLNLKYRIDCSSLPGSLAEKWKKWNKRGRERERKILLRDTRQIRRMTQDLSIHSLSLTSLQITVFVILSLQRHLSDDQHIFRILSSLINSINTCAM